jgi:hypothetical protein
MEAKMLQNKKNNNYDPDREARIAHEKKKDAKNNAQTEINMNSKLSNGNPAYLYPEDPNKGTIVDPTEQLKIAERQREIGDEIDAEEYGEGEGGKIKKLTGGPLTFGEEEPLEFGGKKRRAIKRKATRRK